jgi:branched-chain amino acid aminotransferase
MKDVVKRYKLIRKAYEVLLFNENNEFTEGSQSNLFFIVDNKVVTAPDSIVLKGITRDYVIKSINDLGLDLIKETVLVEDVLKYDAMFISGTSPKVLPISEILSCCKADAANPVLRQIMQAFDKQIEKHLV